MTVATSMADARLTAGVNSDVVITPRVYKTGRALIYCHSASMTGGESIGIGQLPSIPNITKQVVQHSKKVGALAAPTNAVNWGNAVTRQRITDALNWLRATGRANNQPPILMGSSMGACGAISWADLNEAAMVVGFIPAIDLEALRVSNVTLRPTIDAAYGVTYPDAMPPGTNPVNMTLDCPLQLWYATDDAVSTNISTFVAGNNVDLRSLGNLNHTDAAIQAVNVNDILSFIEENS